MRHLQSLTPLRGLAALAVLLFHLTRGGNDTSVPAFFLRGYLGVDLFFVLSGFVLAPVYHPSFLMDAPCPAPLAQRCGVPRGRRGARPRSRVRAERRRHRRAIPAAAARGGEQRRRRGAAAQRLAAALDGRYLLLGLSRTESRLLPCAVAVGDTVRPSARDQRIAGVHRCLDACHRRAPLSLRRDALPHAAAPRTRPAPAPGGTGVTAPARRAPSPGRAAIRARRG